MGVWIITYKAKDKVFCKLKIKGFGEEELEENVKLFAYAMCMAF